MNNIRGTSTKIGIVVFIIIVIALAIAGIVFMFRLRSTTPAGDPNKSNKEPAGYLIASNNESCANCQVSGIVCDADDFTRTTQVSVYEVPVNLNAYTLAELGSPISLAEANLESTEAGAICEGNNAHLFVANLPDKYKNGTLYRLAVFAGDIDSTGLPTGKQVEIKLADQTQFSFACTNTCQPSSTPSSSSSSTSSATPQILPFTLSISSDPRACTANAREVEIRTTLNNPNSSSITVKQVSISLPTGYNQTSSFSNLGKLNGTTVSWNNDGAGFIVSQNSNLLLTFLLRLNSSQTKAFSISAQAMDNSDATVKYEALVDATCTVNSPTTATPLPPSTRIPDTGIFDNTPLYIVIGLLLISLAVRINKLSNFRIEKRMSLLLGRSKQEFESSLTEDK